MQYLNMNSRYQPSGLGDYEGLVDAELAKRVDRANLLLSQAKDMVEGALTIGTTKSTRDFALDNALLKLRTAIDTLKLADLDIWNAMIPGSESVIISCSALIEQITQIQKQMIQEYTSVWGQIKLGFEDNIAVLSNLATTLWAASKAGATSVVENVQAGLEKAADLGFGFTKYIPWILAAVGAVLVLPMVTKFGRNPGRRYKRNPGMSLLPLLAVGGGAAYIIAKKKKGHVIHTVSAAQISIGMVANTLAPALKAALDSVQVAYTTKAASGESTEFFVDARFHSAAQKALEDVKSVTDWKGNLISQALLTTGASA
jgi:hypothetical protein